MQHPKRTWIWLVSLVVLVVAVPLVVSTHARAIENGSLDTGHPYAGALIVNRPNPLINTGLDFGWCSGSLLSSRVFLTAGHCIDFIQSLGVPMDQVWVSFASNILSDRSSWRAVASVALHPLYNVLTGNPGPSGKNSYDVGLVVLAKPVTDITPGKLAPLGLLDRLDAAGGLLHTKISMVGYGLESLVKNQQVVLTGDRRIANMTFLPPLYPNWLGWSIITPSDGEILYQDSGGPALLTVGGTEYVVAIHSTGVPSAHLDGPGFDFRADTAVTQDFVLAAIASAG